jgi:arylsulfatase A-like enzyme
MAYGAEETQRPNIILIMTDDQGWGQMGYYNHPVLKTPNLDAMAANGLRFDRFYAGAPNCSPTRASVMTGRSNDRTGVLNHGYPLRIQEKTLPQAMQTSGYATGHFGKWHLNGFSGPGVPILKDDPRSPGAFGFDEWLSVTNFFEIDPLMSRNGKFEEFKGDSSEVIVDEALEFISRQAESKKPFFTVIWYGSPHSPFIASDEDNKPFQSLDDKSKNHYGELVAMDRSIGTLRKGLRDLDISENTLVWFNSDNGGLAKISPGTAGGLRGNKNSIFEGGLRVPAIVEWPAVITRSRITQHPTVTMDLFPTIAEIARLPESAMFATRDGMSIRPLFDKELGPRSKPIPFRHTGRAALIDNDFKLLTQDYTSGQFELYNLAKDSGETTNIFNDQPEIAKRMVKTFESWNDSVESSAAGNDYPEPFDPKSNPKHGRWAASEQYKPYVEQFQRRRAQKQ